MPTDYLALAERVARFAFSPAWKIDKVAGDSDYEDRKEILNDLRIAASAIRELVAENKRLEREWGIRGDDLTIARAKIRNREAENKALTEKIERLEGALKTAVAYYEEACTHTTPSAGVMCDYLIAALNDQKETSDGNGIG